MSVIFQFVIWWKHQTSSFKIKTFSHLYNIEKYELKIIQIWQFLATAWSRRREICFWLSSAAENLADGLPHKRHDMLSSSYIIQLGLQRGRGDDTKIYSKPKPCSLILIFTADSKLKKYFMGHRAFFAHKIYFPRPKNKSKNNLRFTFENYRLWTSVQWCEG